MNCPFCAGQGTVYASEDRFAVTSDSKLIADESTVSYCPRCGCFYRERRAAQPERIEKVYSEYDLYAPSGRDEARVAFDVSADGIPKSVRELDFLSRFADVPQKGRILDYGCNHGLFLRAFLERYPEWEGTGADIEERYRQSFAGHLPASARYCCLPHEEPGSGFDVICCSHVLEHLPEPAAALRDMASRLAPGGILFIQAVNPLLNPFFHVIFEQHHHFTPAGLRHVLELCGLHLHCINTDWIGKEIAVIAARGPAAGDVCSGLDMEATALQVGRHAESVRAVMAALARIAGSGTPVGIFGASIMGTWMASRLEGLVQCFVDENTALQGGRHLGLPVVPPDKAPAGLPLLCAMPEHMARKLLRRLGEVCPGVLIAPPFSSTPLGGSEGTSHED